jgi:hypothetical protein
MNVKKKPAAENKPVAANKAPKKLTPRTAPPLDKPVAAAPAAAPAPSAAPATAAATAKARKPAAVEPAVAKGQKVLADALSKVQAAKTTKPVPKAEAAKAVSKAPVAAKEEAPVKTETPAKLEKPAAKPVVKPVVPAKDKKPVKVEKPAKVKKVKLVRDSYAMPEAEYARIGELKKRLAGLGSEVKKSELLRAGVAALVALGDAELKALLGKVERIKTGRPAK